MHSQLFDKAKQFNRLKVSQLYGDLKNKTTL